MKIGIKKLSVFKFSIIMTALVIAMAGSINYSTYHMRARASASGPAPTFSGAPGEANCTACHTDFPANSGPGNVVIGGLPKNYLPNQQIPMTVTVNDPVTAVIFGFQMTAVQPNGGRVGTYTIPAIMPPIMQTDIGIVNGMERQYIEHTINGLGPTAQGTKTWNFTWTAPSRRVGKIGFYSAGNGADSTGGPGADQIYTTSKQVLSGTAISSFDGDGTSEFGVFRPSTGVWYSLNSTDGGVQTVSFGLNGDKPVPGDYDGDGITDRAVFRPSTSVWYILRSSGGVDIYTFGLSEDIPVPGDYDGDLKTDIAVFRPSTSIWYIQKSTGGIIINKFGLVGDRTTQGDFDGDAKTDIAVYRPSTGIWYLLQSADGFAALRFGLDGDQPVQGDYDGDGRHDVAIFRPSTGVWYILGSSQGISIAQFGLSADKATPADYDGDGKADIAVFRPSTGVWYALRSTDGSASIAPFGLNGDIPIASGYIAE